LDKTGRPCHAHEHSDEKKDDDHGKHGAFRKLVLLFNWDAIQEHNINM
jgi:hypothetical protein